MKLPRRAQGGRPRRRTVALVLVAAVASGALMFQVLAGTLRDRTRADAEAVLAQSETAIGGWLARYRALPDLYARDPRLVAAMAGTPQPGALDDLGRELAAWNEIAGTSDTYVMAPDGTTVAASNWNSAVSFVGRNFSFRPYFIDAMAGRPGSFFGLGITSGLRGYYLSAPIRQGERILGAVVVKISVPALEKVLAEIPHPLFVSDAAGVVILSTLRELRLTALAPVGADLRRRVLSTRPYDLSQVAAAPLTALADPQGAWPLVRGPAADAGAGSLTYLATTRPLPEMGWRLHLLYDVRPVRQQMWILGGAILAAGTAAAALAGLALQRRARLIQRLADRNRDRHDLRRRVAARTAQLTQANARLLVEVEDRRAAEDSLRRTQSELVQAGKLAALGQMSAALSHEFNQPLTAIRTYSENAAAFYEAGRADRAAENIARVLRLTERMAKLSKSLTRFARRSGDDIVPVDLDAVIDEALALTSARLERSDAGIAVSGQRGLSVLGGATRLQHVVMNLIANALDAVPEGTAPEIGIGLVRKGDTVEMSVVDNGTGIEAEALPRIFDPFFTTKEVGRGLGLGLSICYNIVRDFGGAMRAENRPEGGARLVVTLRAADALDMAAE